MFQAEFLKSRWVGLFLIWIATHSFIHCNDKPYTGFVSTPKAGIVSTSGSKRSYILVASKLNKDNNISVISYRRVPRSPFQPTPTMQSATRQNRDGSNDYYEFHVEKAMTVGSSVQSIHASRDAATLYVLSGTTIPSVAVADISSLDSSKPRTTVTPTSTSIPLENCGGAQRLVVSRDERTIMVACETTQNIAVIHINGPDSRSVSYIETGCSPLDVAMDRDGKNAIAACFHDHQLVQIKLDSAAHPLVPIFIGTSPQRIVYTPETKTVLVASTTGIKLFDSDGLNHYEDLPELSKQMIRFGTQSVPLSTTGDLSDFRISTNGRRLVIVSRQDRSVQVLRSTFLGEDQRDLVEEFVGGTLPFPRDSFSSEITVTLPDLPIQSAVMAPDQQLVVVPLQSNQLAIVRVYGYGVAEVIQQIPTGTFPVDAAFVTSSLSR